MKKYNELTKEDKRIYDAIILNNDINAMFDFGYIVGSIEQLEKERDTLKTKRDFIKASLTK